MKTYAVFNIVFNSKKWAIFNNGR